MCGRPAQVVRKGVEMKISLFRCLWGVIKPAGGHLTIPDALSAVRGLGKHYAGVEVPIRVIMEHGRKDFVSQLEKNDLKVIPMVFSGGPMAPGWGGPKNSITNSPGSKLKHPVPNDSVDRHVAVFKSQVYEILEAIPPMRLSKITAHSGLDSFTRQQSLDFFGQILEFQQKNLPKEVQINHETHRGRILYSAWVMRDLLPELTKIKSSSSGGDSKHGQEEPALTVFADYSHHVAVAEADPTNCLSGALHSTVQSFSPLIRHVHARYGYDQGPQIPDPRYDPPFLSFLPVRDSLSRALLLLSPCSSHDLVVCCYCVNVQ